MVLNEDIMPRYVLPIFPRVGAPCAWMQVNDIGIDGQSVQLNPSAYVAYHAERHRVVFTIVRLKFTMHNDAFAIYFHSEEAVCAVCPECELLGFNDFDLLSVLEREEVPDKRCRMSLNDALCDGIKPRMWCCCRLGCCLLGVHSAVKFLFKPTG